MVFVALVLAATMTSAGHSLLEVKRPWARPGNRGGNSAVYMEIHNAQSQADRLVAASTPVAEAVELHETRLAGEMHRMQRVRFIKVPAHGKVELRPGGLHVMLIRLKTSLRVGDRFPLILRFERAGRVSVEVEVREQARSGGGHK